MTAIYPVHSIGAPCCTPSDRSIAATGGAKTTRMPGICLAAVVLVATLATPAGAVVQRFWDAGEGFWSNPVNWSPNGVPINTENIFIGELTQNHTVTLDQDVAVASLHISNGMELLTNGHQFIAYGLTTLGDNASMTISDAELGIDYYTDDFSILQSSTVTLDDATLEVTGNFVIAENATLQGIGQTLLWGSGMTTFSNSGSVMFGSGISSIHQLSDGLYDLDGPFDGVLSAGSIAIGSTSAEALVTISGLGTTDPFSGTLTLGPHARLTMVVGGWEADADSQIEVTGSGGGPGYSTSRLDGSHVTLAGSINVSGHAQFLVHADATIEPTATLDVAPENIVDFRAEIDAVSPQETTINGGVFTLGQASLLEFHDLTTIRGGVFSTFSNLSSGGGVRFSGPTEWDGTVALNGFTRQNGDATVTGPTVIDADVFDMDGLSGETTWNVGDVIVVNAAHVDEILFDDKFNGTIDIGGGFAPQLTVNLDDPDGSWTMAGDMNLAGVPAASFYINRLAGSPVQITGELNVDHRVRVTADTTFDEDSVVNFAGGSAAIQMTGRTVVHEGAEFVGAGLLDNGATGQMTLADGASLDQVGLTNRGLLEIGDSPGFASVDRFTNLSGGTWRVEIGGELLGDEFDHLQVTGGGATLDGLLEVDLIAPPGLVIGPGSGPFMPEVGDTFTILTALGGVDGQFIDSNPVSKAGGKFFHWSVLYHPFDVTLQLTSVSVPEPASMMLLIAGAIATRAGRRPRKVSLRANNLSSNACQSKDQTHD